MNILFIGHSLIEFFDWQERFPEHKVTNLGVAGETVGKMLSRIKGITESLTAPDTIFLMSGLNDVAMGVMDFSKDYRESVKMLADAYPDTKIYVNSILPTLSAFIPDSRIRKANDELKEIAGDHGAVFLDIYSLFVDTNGVPDKNLFLDDEVHLSDRGYREWALFLEGIIES